MIKILYIWARNSEEAMFEIKYGYGLPDKNKVLQGYHGDDDKLFEVKIEVEEHKC